MTDCDIKYLYRLPLVAFDDQVGLICSGGPIRFYSDIRRNQGLWIHDYLFRSVPDDTLVLCKLISHINLLVYTYENFFVSCIGEV